MRTMGVDQAALGLEVSIAEWSPSGGRTALFDGVIGGTWTDLVSRVLTLAQLFEVQRALVDPHPDAQFASRLLDLRPEVFAHESGSQHNAASLAEAAWRRTQSDATEPVLANVEGAHVVAVGADLIDPSCILVRAFVPAGEPVPSHMIVDLADADVMERADGSRIVERLLPMEHISLPVAAPVQSQMRQIWSLAPTSTLPTRGWSLVLSVYGNGVLQHEQVVTDPQMMGLGNITRELAFDATNWIERSHPAGNGPWQATFALFAGQTQVHADSTSEFSTPLTLSGSIHDKAVLVGEWIFDNAVAQEQLHPGINLPEPGPYDLPPIEKDTFDFQH